MLCQRLTHVVPAFTPPFCAGLWASWDPTNFICQIPLPVGFQFDSANVREWQVIQRWEDVLVFYCCRNNLPQIQWFKTTLIDYLMAL